jgi:5,10-methylene-tetrahydrofolate dehydrogenase/methenyl tetrahydrofolate cyclohydrolase
VEEEVLERKRVVDVPSVTEVISVCGDLRCTPAPGGVGLATDDELLEELVEKLLAVNAARKIGVQTTRKSHKCT